jgi:2-(1,2-epoxy-1,2-dihydrophenyl)acetyl-CoA isomerase
MKDSDDLLVRREMQVKLGEELAAAELDREIGCILLTGSGGAFCAGGDVKNMARAAGQPIDQLRRMEAQRQSQRRTSLGKPTSAALSGAAAGAGLSIALAYDMRIAADTAIMSTAFVKIGLSGDYGGTYLLTQLVGPAKARELYLLGDRIDMTEAFRLGLEN